MDNIFGGGASCVVCISSIPRLNPPVASGTLQDKTKMISRHCTVFPGEGAKCPWLRTTILHMPHGELCLVLGSPLFEGQSHTGLPRLEEWDEPGGGVQQPCH